MRQADNNLKLSEAKESHSREFSDYWWGLKKLFCFTPGQMYSSLLKVYEGNKRHPRIIQGLPLSGAYFINRVQLFQENVQKIKHTSLAFPWVNGCLWGEQLCTVVWVLCQVIKSTCEGKRHLAFLHYNQNRTFFFGLYFGNNKTILDKTLKYKKPHISQDHQQPKNKIK